MNQFRLFNFLSSLPEIAFTTSSYCDIAPSIHCQVHNISAVLEQKICHARKFIPHFISEFFLELPPQTNFWILITHQMAPWQIPRLASMFERFTLTLLFNQNEKSIPRRIIQGNLLRKSKQSILRILSLIWIGNVFL